MPNLKVVFWNLQSANPIGKNLAKRGHEIQNTIIKFDADLLIFCEVTDEAIREIEVASSARICFAAEIWRAQSEAREGVDDQEPDENEEDSVPAIKEGKEIDLNNNNNMIGTGSATSNKNKPASNFASPKSKGKKISTPKTSPARTGSAKTRVISPNSQWRLQPTSMRLRQVKLSEEFGIERTARRSKFIMKKATQANNNPQFHAKVQYYNRWLMKSKWGGMLAAQMKNPSFKNDLDLVDLPPLIKKYPFWQVYKPNQANRNYIIFSKDVVLINAHDVKVTGAKRAIVDIEYASKARVLTVHAPAFAKGGLETAKQICEMIKQEKQRPVFAIGDFNIDSEEVSLVVKEVDKNHLLYDFLTKSGVKIVAEEGSSGQQEVPRSYSKSGKPNIKKKHLATQKSGRTLDYLLAPINSTASTQIIILVKDSPSDHAAIMSTIEL